MDHSPGFLKIVNEARPRIRELTPDEARQHLDANASAVLVDVREDSEWAARHAVGAVHLGKGIIERDIENQLPDMDRELILYCGGGFRSILAADALRIMGYRNVFSLDGGFKKMSALDWAMTSEK